MHNAKYELLPNIKQPKYSLIYQLLVVSGLSALVLALLACMCYIFQNYHRAIYILPQQYTWERYARAQTEKAEIHFENIINTNYPLDILYNKSLESPTKDYKKLNYLLPDSIFKLVCFLIIERDSIFERTISNLEPDLCTHINIGFFEVHNSSIQITTFQDAILREMAQLKLHNPNLKTLISVGGALAEGLPEMILNHRNRKKFIKSVVDAIRTYELSGVDLDWEFPNWDNPLNDDRQRQHFTQLLEEIRKEINRHSEGKKFLLSVDVAAIPSIIDTAYDIQYLNQYVDYVNIMCYDYMMWTKLTPFTGFNAPLYKDGCDRGLFQTLNINYTAHMWISRGLDRNKMVIGLPTYGHSYKLFNPTNNGIHAPASGFGDTGVLGFIKHSDAQEFLEDVNVKSIFDLDTRSPFAYNENDEWISYENVHSLTSKTEYIKDNNFGGAMLFSLNTDDWIGDNLTDAVANYTNLFHLHRIVKNVLFDDSL